MRAEGHPKAGDVAEASQHQGAKKQRIDESDVSISTSA